MKFSLAISMCDPSHYLPLAQVAEAAGWDAVCVPDGGPWTERTAIAYRGGKRWWAADTPFLDPFVVIPAMAALTKHIRLYTNVLKLPIRSPLLIARAVASAAVLAGDRIALGWGWVGTATSSKPWARISRRAASAAMKSSRSCNCSSAEGWSNTTVASTTSSDFNRHRFRRKRCRSMWAVTRPRPCVERRASGMAGARGHRPPGTASRRIPEVPWRSLGAPRLNVCRLSGAPERHQQKIVFDIAQNQQQIRLGPETPRACWDSAPRRPAPGPPAAAGSARASAPCPRGPARAGSPGSPPAACPGRTCAQCDRGVHRQEQGCPFP